MTPQTIASTNEPTDARETVIHDFGAAPQAAPYYLADEVQGTTEEMCKLFGGQDVVIVTSAAVHGKPGTNVYGVFRLRQPAAAVH